MLSVIYHELSCTSWSFTTTRRAPCRKSCDSVDWPASGGYHVLSDATLVFFGPSFFFFKCCYLDGPPSCFFFVFFFLSLRWKWWLCCFSTSRLGLLGSPWRPSNRGVSSFLRPNNDLNGRNGRNPSTQLGSESRVEWDWLTCVTRQSRERFPSPITSPLLNFGKQFGKVGGDSLSFFGRPCSKVLFQERREESGFLTDPLWGRGGLLVAEGGLFLKTEPSSQFTFMTLEGPCRQSRKTLVHPVVFVCIIPQQQQLLNSSKYYGAVWCEVLCLPYALMNWLCPDFKSCISLSIEFCTTLKTTTFWTGWTESIWIGYRPSWEEKSGRGGFSYGEYDTEEKERETVDIEKELPWTESNSPLRTSSSV